jgi:hypothetical protein
MKGESSKEEARSDMYVAEKIGSPTTQVVPCSKCGDKYPSKSHVCTPAGNPDWEDNLKPHRDQFADIDDKPLKVCPLGYHSHCPLVCAWVACILSMSFAQGPLLECLVCKNMVMHGRSVVYVI